MLEVQKDWKVVSGAKGCNYCYDVKRDLTLQIPLNCRNTVCKHCRTAAENTKSKESQIE